MRSSEENKDNDKSKNDEDDFEDIYDLIPDNQTPENENNEEDTSNSQEVRSTEETEEIFKSSEIIGNINDLKDEKIIDTFEEEDITEVSEITEEEDITEVSEITEEEDITEVSEITEEEDITEVSEVTEEENITEVNEITEEGVITEASETTEEGVITEASEITEEGVITEVSEITEEGVITEASENIDELYDMIEEKVDEVSSDEKDLEYTLETAFFSLSRPLRVIKLAETLDVDERDVRSAVKRIRARMKRKYYAFRLDEIATDIFLMHINDKLEPDLQKLLTGEDIYKFAKFEIDVLTNIAYRQPIKHTDLIKMMEDQYNQAEIKLSIERLVASEYISEEKEKGSTILRTTRKFALEFGFSTDLKRLKLQLYWRLKRNA